MNTRAVTQRLFDGLRQLDVAQVREALAQKPDLSTLNAQQQGVFSALFHCNDPDDLGLSEVQAMTRFNTLEDLLLKFGAPVADATYEGKPLLAGVLDTAFFNVSQALTEEKTTVQRIQRWLAHPDVKGAGDMWGEECAEVWVNHMNQDHEEATSFGLAVLPLLLNDGMAPQLIEVLDPDVSGHAVAMGMAAAVLRTHMAAQQTPIPTRRRRLT